MNKENKLVSGLESASAVATAATGALGALVALFTTVAKTRDGLRKISMPNIPMKTGGGKVWWRDLANENGWRLQKNIVWGTCRILDPNNVRLAWGGEEAMFKALQEIA